MCSRADVGVNSIVHVTVCLFKVLFGWHIIAAARKARWRRWKFFMLTDLEYHSHAKFHMEFNVAVK
jgi:hypothetical protein